jgi:hypothetical protein|tara:strand:+ start:334 stop:2508 length:2175 start_codon:yes stop_codon:yes gene_type:complete
MTELQLYIEGQEVELHDNESVVLKQALQDVRNLDKVFTDFTRTFNVPASTVNNKLFKHFYNFNIIGFDARHKQEATLNLNYKPFKKGKIKLEGVQMKDNQPVNYRLTFYGSLVSLKDIFASDKISSLDGLSITLDYTSASISNLLQNGTDILLNGETISKGFIAPLITHTDRLYYNSTQDTAGSFNLYPTSTAKGVVWNQLKPAVKVYAIVKAIEFKYNIQFSTDFFSLTNTAFDNLYLWLHKQKGGVFDIETRNLVSVTGWSNIIGSIDGGTFTLDSFLNESIAADVNRYLALTVATSNTAEYEIIVYYDEEIIHNSEHTGGANVIRFLDQFRIQNPTRTNEQSVVDSDRIHVKILSSSAATFSVKMSVRDAASDGTNRDVEAFTENVNTTVTKIVATDQMPDIGIMEFLTGLFKMFNLTAFFEDNIIKVLPLDDFFASSTATYDITKYLDKANSEVNSALPYSSINFSYKEAKSFFAANHKQQFNQDWGSLKYEDLGSAEGSTYTVQLPFENQKFERLKDSGGTAYTTVQWGYSVDIKQDPYLGKPLLFYAMREDDTVGVLNPISYLDGVGGNQSTLNAYYIPSNSVNPLTDTQTLNFGSEKSEYARINYDKSLFSTYYKNYIVDTFSENRRLSKFQAYLPLSIISKLKLQDKIIVFNNLYKINTISTNLQNGLSTFELINEVTNFTISALANPQDEARTIDNDTTTADTTLVRADNALQRI